MRTYLVTVETDMDFIGEYSDTEIYVTNAPSALEADRAAFNHAGMMNWCPGGTVGTTEPVKDVPVDATVIRYTGIR